MGICGDYATMALKKVKVTGKNLHDITIHLRHNLAYRKSNRSTNVLENLNGNGKRSTSRACCNLDGKAVPTG
ncbi:hypothetical protein [Pasteuria penetrans]|uniref:hypothetical protein n=1 Tax=Pasteuria penetrans TaxID=86005 RepID=UPI000FA63C05|nr:hypothetical protein [Pasteuria penetrans]